MPHLCSSNSWFRRRVSKHRWISNNPPGAVDLCLRCYLTIWHHTPHSLNHSLHSLHQAAWPLHPAGSQGEALNGRSFTVQWLRVAFFLLLLLFINLFCSALCLRQDPEAWLQGFEGESDIFLSDFQAQLVLCLCVSLGMSLWSLSWS